MASARLQRWQAVRALPGNGACAECSTPTVPWVVIDYGVLICVHCAAAHRALGSHISKVRSVSHDVFTDAEMDWIESMGNAKSNGLFEPALPAGMRRPLPSSSDAIRRTWLRLKYDEQRWVAGTEHREAPPHESQAGWLLKRGSVVPSWKRRYFRVRPGALLCYYTDESGSEESLRGAFELAGASLEPDDEYPLTLRLRAQRAGGEATVLVAKAASSAEAEAWSWAVYQLSHLPPRADADGRPSARGTLFGGKKQAALAALGRQSC